jgi:hypothetical protein
LAFNSLQFYLFCSHDFAVVDNSITWPMVSVPLSAVHGANWWWLNFYFFRRHWLKVCPLPEGQLKSTGRGDPDAAMQKQASSPIHCKSPN